ncbi:MAG: hypothetical protein DLM62_02535 [Pseudonocardiales bacterium]|nr:MAG: hypothetical protein DLM62_02535 [Pseudonocardiales bacterium]
MIERVAGAYASDDFDASVLVVPLVGFLPATAERMWATFEAIERELGGGCDADRRLRADRGRGATGCRPGGHGRCSSQRAGQHNNRHQFGEDQFGRPSSAAV